jgi:hypothetical protein
VHKLTNVIHHDEKRATEEGSKPCRTPYIAVEEDAGGDRGRFLLPPLNAHKGYHEQAEYDEEGNNVTALPCVLAASPLQSEQQADDSREETKSAFDIKLSDFLPQCPLGFPSTALDVEEGDDEGGSYSAKREVDVETPSPCKVVGKSSTHPEALLTSEKCAWFPKAPLTMVLQRTQYHTCHQ